MQDLLLKLLARSGDLTEGKPLIALFLGSALLAVFLTVFFQTKAARDGPAGPASLVWLLYRNGQRLLWSAVMIALLLGAMTVLRIYLNQVNENFDQAHGRISQANYSAVQTIWGAEQQQGELKVDIYHNEVVTERIESEDPTKPAILRQKTVHVSVVGNPYLSENHVVTLTQSPRKKGSAYYGGYETDCSFAWRLRSPADSAQSCTLVFPLPAAQGVYDGLTATLNGVDVLPKMAITESSLTLETIIQPGEEMDFHIAFKSRGLSYWYFQIAETREIRDFTLTLNLSDLPRERLNYPAECMTPTDIKPTANGQGTVLTYRLDHSLSNKGMGIALPQPLQPGETTRAVLNQIENAWLLTFAVLALGFSLAGVRQPVLLTVLFGTATALGYGLLGDFSDLLFGFWGTVAFILVPLFLLLAWLLTRVGRTAGLMLAVEFLLCGLLYPCAAGLDSERQSLYLDLYGLLLLAANIWLLAGRMGGFDSVSAPVAMPKPA